MPSRPTKKKHHSFDCSFEIFTNWALDWECSLPSLCVSSPSSLCSGTFFTPIFSLLTCLHVIPPHSLNACSSVNLSPHLIKTKEREKRRSWRKGKNGAIFLCALWRQPARIFPGDVKVHSLASCKTAKPEITRTLLPLHIFNPEFHETKEHWRKVPRIHSPSVSMPQLKIKPLLPERLRR